MWRARCWERRWLRTRSTRPAASANGVGGLTKERKHDEGNRPRRVRCASEVLRVTEVDTPEVAEEEVLVRVHAASIHIGAVYGVRGYPKVMRPMFKSLLPETGVVGTNIAGVVEAVGANVTELRPCGSTTGRVSSAPR